MLKQAVGMGKKRLSVCDKEGTQMKGTPELLYTVRRRIGELQHPQIGTLPGTTSSDLPPPTGLPDKGAPLWRHPNSPLPFPGVSTRTAA